MFGRQCTTCKETRAASDFGTQKLGRDGLRSQCKACCRAKRSSVRKERRVEVLAAEKAYRDANPDIIKAAQIAYCERNRLKLNARAIAWNRANPEKHRANVLRHQRVDSWMKHLATKSRHDAKARGRDCDLVEADIRALFEQQKGCCYWLGIELKPSLESRDPQRPSVDRLDITRGYTRDNIVLACQFANMGRNIVTASRFREFLVANRLIRE